MPKNKFQEVIFTIIMVFFMVYAMICYNIALNIGGMSNEIFLADQLLLFLISLLCPNLPSCALHV